MNLQAANSCMHSTHSWNMPRYVALKYPNVCERKFNEMIAEKKERENESESSSKRTTMTPGKISPGKWEQKTVENAFHQPKSLVWV